LLDRRGAGLKEDLQGATLPVPIEVLTVEIHDHPHCVPLIHRVGVADLHQPAELVEGSQIGRPLGGGVRAVGQPDVPALEVREVSALARVVADARLPSPAPHDRTLRAKISLLPGGILRISLPISLPETGKMVKNTRKSAFIYRCRTG